MIYSEAVYMCGAKEDVGPSLPNTQIKDHCISVLLVYLKLFEQRQ
jgi:hypothetical protein